MSKSLGPTFHRSFPLQTAVLAQYLGAVAKAGRPLSPAEIRGTTGLGTMKVPSAAGYGRGTGLLQDSGALSLLGATVLSADPNLNELSTKWLLHAGLSRLEPVAPDYWPILWSLLRFGSIIDRSDVDATVLGCYAPGYLSPDSGRVSATAFISTYVQTECLGDLRLLSKEGGQLRAGVPGLRTTIGV